MAVENNSLTFVAPILASDVAFLQAMIGVTVTPPPVSTDFPADPTTAPVSPEDSEITLYKGKIYGPPYLKDSNHCIHTLTISTAAGSYSAGGISTLYEVNGAAPQIGAQSPAVLLIVRQGLVYVEVASGQWTIFNSVMGDMNEVGGDPPPASTGGSGGGGGTPIPPVPPLPTPSTIAPGSSGHVILCGAGQVIPTLSAAIPGAQPGDTIKVSPGTYTDTPPAWSVPLLIDLGGATFNGTGQDATLARGKGLLVPAADSIIQNGTIIGVGLSSPTGDLTSAIRPDTGCGYLTIKDMQIHGNQCAVGEGTIGAIVIELDSCDISGNGLLSNTGGSLSHNLYVGADCVKLTLNNVTSTGPIEGHAIKYRGPQPIVTGGSFDSEPGKPFDFPDGTSVAFTITGATITKLASAADHGILGYAEEGQPNGLAGGTLTNCTVNIACPNPYIVGPGGTVTFKSCTITGGPITTSGGISLATA